MGKKYVFNLFGRLGSQDADTQTEWGDKMFIRDQHLWNERKDWAEGEVKTLIHQISGVNIVRQSWHVCHVRTICLCLYTHFSLRPQFRLPWEESVLQPGISLQLRWTWKELTARSCLPTALCSWVARTSCRGGVAGRWAVFDVHLHVCYICRVFSTYISFLANTLDCNLLITTHLLPRMVG